MKDIRGVSGMHTFALAAGALLVAGGVVLPSPTAAQERGDWAPWVGCWQPAPGFAGPELCVTRVDGGVELVTVAEGEISERRTLMTGVDRAIDEGECRGTETASFSGDGNRVYHRATVVCDGVEQSSSGILAMLAPGEWVDVNVVTVEGREATWVQRYVTAGSGVAVDLDLGPVAADRATMLRRARIAALALPDVQQVIEASGQVDPGAVQAWLAEMGSPLELDADRLLQMVGAGVPESVIDIVVAVSNPRHFTVRGAAAGAGGVVAELAEGERAARGGQGGPYAAVLYGPGYGYSPYGSYYGYGASPYGWSPGWGWAPGYHSYRPTVVVVERPEVQGRRVKGGGYQAGGTGTPSGSSTSRVPDMGPDRRDTGSSGASSTPSSGGSQAPASTGRTAKPRPPGGL